VSAVEQQVHDLRRRTWGHSIEFLRRQDDGAWRAVIYLSARVADGDHVIVEGQRDGVPSDLRYRVVGDVDRPLDPGDQHFVTLVFDPEPSR
jgi:hypothetical protein